MSNLLCQRTFLILHYLGIDYFAWQGVLLTFCIQRFEDLLVVSHFCTSWLVGYIPRFRTSWYLSMFLRTTQHQFRPNTYTTTNLAATVQRSKTLTRENASSSVINFKAAATNKNLHGFMVFHQSSSQKQLEFWTLEVIAVVLL